MIITKLAASKETNSTMTKSVAATLIPNGRVQTVNVSTMTGSVTERLIVLTDLMKVNTLK